VSDPDRLLEVENLRVAYPGRQDPAVDGVSFGIDAGESVALAGASGSGKTQTALAIMGLLSPGADVSGRIRFGDTDIIGADRRTLRRLRARKLAMVFQDPAAALNPHLRIGDQLRLVLEAHGLARGAAARRRAIDMLERTGLPDPQRQARAWPHELSGGMRQRALIAAALIAGPALLIADEPTTALDTTIQAQILRLLGELRVDTGIALLLITHDLGVIAGNSSRLLVIDGGRLVEEGATAALFARPEHAATRGMLAAVRTDPQLRPAPPAGEPLLAVDGVSIVYSGRQPGRPWRRQRLTAVHPLDLTLARAETLAIVGESGAGKTSLVRAILGLLPPSRGRVSLLGRELPARLARRRRRDLALLQLVFQDPVGSFDPAMTLAESVGEPLRVHEPGLDRRERLARVRAALDGVGLGEEFLDRHPHEVSGGQAQRAAIARALIPKPQLLVCDEAVAALDAPVRHGVLELIAAEQRASGLAVLFISHDLAVVQSVSHRVMVMYMGHVVELAQCDRLFARPRHPYTRALLDAAPVADPAAAAGARPLAGEPSSVRSPPSGCVFHPRCAWAIEVCRTEPPALSDVNGTRVACHRAGELDLSAPR